MLSETSVREAYDTLKAFILMTREIEMDPTSLQAQAIYEQHVQEGVTEDARRKSLFTLLHALAGILELDEESVQGFQEMMENARNSVLEWQRLRRHKDN